jgi:hypothetical protein
MLMTAGRMLMGTRRERKSHPARLRIDRSAPKLETPDGMARRGGQQRPREVILAGRVHALCSAALLVEVNPTLLAPVS